uniref:Pescadillo homolog n=1 Tax=Globodera rostochiensis TaxID=31243 RepID=A0A914GZ88_GLORO
MKKIKRKFDRGTARVFVSRKKALKKLQVNLKDFRRLCILKGIYPREPNKVKKANKGGSSEHKIFYHLKDINFLAQEPLLNKFREYKIFLRRITRARAKRDNLKLDGLLQSRPTFTYDHLVRERFPTFVSALRDMDDALCLCFSFAALTQSKIAPLRTINQCRRTVTEFMHYVIEANALRKVFISIKGVYYQAEIMGERVTWVVGHERAVGRANELDFSVMANFVDFYVCMLSFVNYRLFKALGLFYPPQLHRQLPPENEYFFERSNDLDERVYSLAFPLKRTDKSDADCAPIDTFADDQIDDGDSLAEKLRQAEALKTLFAKFKFFLNREVPKEPLAFVIRSCGGFVCWEGCSPSSVDESSELITHQIVDRNVERTNINRVYVQPQWVFDCFNSRRILPSVNYAPMATLPPHLSPFVEEHFDGPDRYVPLERIEQAKENCDITAFLGAKSVEPKNGSNKKKKEAGKSEATAMAVQKSKVHKESRQKQINAEGHNLKLREMMVAKKHRRVYGKIKYGLKRKAQEANKLAEKRAKLTRSEGNGTEKAG